VFVAPVGRRERVLVPAGVEDGGTDLVEISPRIEVIRGPSPCRA
jgi:hypothetical protein